MDRERARSLMLQILYSGGIMGKNVVFEIKKYLKLE